MSGGDGRGSLVESLAADLKESWKSTGPPEILPDELEYHEKIGGGCFGNVYKGTCRGKEVAIKKLFKQDLDEKTLIDFKKEVEIMSQLRHPNVLLFMGACTTPGEMAIVTELLKKGNCEQVLQDKNNHVTNFLRVKMLKDMAQGMCWLHESKPQIIHRDLKPSNLLVDEHYNVKVCDFGLSAVKPISGEKLQDKDSVPGTPLWMAPEILRGQPFDASSDVYSFGICAWEIYTGKEVFPDMQSFSQFKRAICFKDVRPPLESDMPPSLTSLLKSCWHKDSTQRPSIREIIAILNTILVDVAIKDPKANTFWKTTFLGKDEVPWAEFKTALVEFLGLPTPITPDVEDMLTYLRHLVGTRSPKVSIEVPPKAVSLEAWGNLLHWFGPLTQGSAFLENVRTTMQQPWFHGDLESSDAEKALADRKKGHFLVRMSTTKPGSFTISKMASKGVNHQRVAYKAETRTFSIRISKGHGKKKSVKTIKSTGSLEEFIRTKLSGELMLKMPCPGSKYAFLYGMAVQHDPAAAVDGYVAVEESDSGEESSDYD